MTSNDQTGAALAEPLIRMRNLRKVYRKRNEEFLAVSDVTMDIYPGDLYEIRQTTALWTTPLIPTEPKSATAPHLGDPGDPGSGPPSWRKRRSTSGVRA